MMFYDWATWAAKELQAAGTPAKTILELVKSAEEMVDEEKDYMADSCYNSPRDYDCNCDEE